jgi:energy-coupling factor transport system permease protein
MFVISLKRAADLADAMEARGYIPGAPRTKINESILKAKDIIMISLSIIISVSIITLSILLNRGII